MDKLSQTTLPKLTSESEKIEKNITVIMGEMTKLEGDLEDVNKNINTIKSVTPKLSVVLSCEVRNIYAFFRLCLFVINTFHQICST